MFYITGDTHGVFSRYQRFAVLMEPSETDTMIVLGDAGLNYYKRKKDELRKKFDGVSTSQPVFRHIMRGDTFIASNICLYVKSHFQML